MKMTGNSILITGGATGIGYALAKDLLARGNDVLICGRREDRLASAESRLPVLRTFACDVASDSGREALLAHVREHFPRINMLINNAGIQRDIDLKKGVAELDAGESEILTNLVAPIYLSGMLTSLLAEKENAAIVNVSSDLAFKPEYSTDMPVYCATKAGLHAFSIVQRRQLAPLGIRVIEIIPPMVESELNIEARTRKNVLKTPYMLTASEFAEYALAKMETDAHEIMPEKR